MLVEHDQSIGDSTGEYLPLLSFGRAKQFKSAMYSTAPPVAFYLLLLEKPVNEFNVGASQGGVQRHLLWRCSFTHVFREEEGPNVN